MSDWIQKITDQSGELTDEETVSLNKLLASYFERPVLFTEEGLASFAEEELEIIHDTMKGLILTKASLADIQSITGNPEIDYPQEVSFGSIDKAPPAR
ncbi:hypothetical protein C2I18_23540 [Paenibacillus sp. PK3_47]|uniref:hypothetical protein n=1 Tax=Paenibacillus sp. PK3_47 TaxID=2072642 RepID=UPI00201D4A3E|nr:hypothetical protein [Paenibacillus sp. PK3_47]UQZ36234.1 hypothetical protein C2I18_23540 [Paenibacillus sp. PK3_47]